MTQSQEAQNVFVFPDLVRGTTLRQQAFEVLINDAAPASNLTAVSCVFAKDGVTTITATCAITSAVNWQFTVGPVAASSMGIDEGLHVGDIKTTAADGTIRKYCRVEQTILPSPQ